MAEEIIHNYKLTYQLERVTAEQAKEKDVGATDAFVFISMLFPEDGALSVTSFSRDGRTGKNCEPQELFKAWLYLTKTILQNPKTSNWQKTCCQMGLDAFEELMKKTMTPIADATGAKKMDS